MIQMTPDYYDQFRCIGKECTDNCCIGWEIDIDSRTYQKYLTQQGKIGEKLRQTITHEEKDSPSHFILEGERCPFLNGENLCELICVGGDEMLCDICSNHPRFFEWYGDIKEAGVGLCCEEAARIIISSKEKVSLNIKEIEENAEGERPESYMILFPIRQRLFEIAQNRDFSIFERMARLLKENLDFYEDVCCEDVHFGKNEEQNENKYFSKIIKLMQKMEPLDPQWPRTLKQISLSLDQKEFKKYIKQASKNSPWEYENLLVYFIFRYYMKSCYEDVLLTAVQFSVSAVLVILFIDALNLECAEKMNRMENAKFFSKEIEYSEENMQKLFDQFVTCPDLSYAALQAALENLLRL